ncbi:hypothetical protein AAG906_022171 [Vitis piasezkii]
MEVSNKQVIFRDYITGFPKETDLVLNTSTISLKVPKESNGVLVKNLYLSSRVLDSGDPNFRESDLIWGTTGWEEYSLITTSSIRFKIQHTDVPLSYYTGIFCSSCLCKILVGFHFVASQECQLLGQFAKLMGCYVVGSVGSKEKNKLGFNEAFNYKEKHELDAALKRLTPVFCIKET